MVAPSLQEHIAHLIKTYGAREVVECVRPYYKMDRKKHIVAVTGIIPDRERTRVLVAQRGPDEIAFPSKWAWPGGKVEPGQTIFEALSAEINQEVGLGIEDAIEYLRDYTFVRPDGHNVIGISYLVRPTSFEVRLAPEFQAYRWITPEELSDLDYIDGMEKEREMAFSRLR